MTGDQSAHTTYVRGLKSISEHAREAANLVEHPGEKGRILEGIAKALLLRFLPKRYSVGTGVIITSAGQASKQTDIVIYDNQRNTPLMFESDVGLFPIECVYGTIEVKSKIDGGELSKSAKASSLIRGFKDSKQYYSHILRKRDDGQWSNIPVRFKHSLAPKSFIFGFDCNYQSIDTFREAVQSASSANATHIHGAVALKRNWFVRQVPFKQAFEATDQSGLEHFLLAMLGELDSMGDLLAADMSKYFAGIDAMQRYFLTPAAATST